MNDTVLKSQLDASVNFIEEQLMGFVETRYVRKCPEYFIAYISSQTGCNRGCRFCHLTATKQTKFEDVSIHGMVSQAETIFGEYVRSYDHTAKYVHFNFMARGEPLNNTLIQAGADTLFFYLGKLANVHGLYPKFNISTIIPKDSPPLVDIFRTVTPTIYYSIYSVKDAFRKKWMPNALPVKDSLDRLKAYQEMSKKIIKFHCAFIEGENDDLGDIEDMMNLIKAYNIMGEFNIVHYNPYSSEQGVESSNLDNIFGLINTYMPVKIIPRVGFDVKASCGMFVGKNINGISQ